jgi:glutaredoxin
MKIMKYLGLFLLLVILSMLATAEIYKWVDENGKIHFSDTPPVNNNAETLDEQKLIARTSSYTSVSIDKIPPSNIINPPEKLTIYTTASCGYCLKAKKYFAENKIPYKEKNIETSKKFKREFKKLGGKGVPVIMWKDKLMRGFSARKFEKTYGDNT